MTGAKQNAALPDGFRLGVAELAVSDLRRSLDFYERVVGLRVIGEAAGESGAAAVELGGQGGAPVVRLVETPGATPKPRDAAGLFHVAILLPGREDLAVTFARLMKLRALTGASDHLVSEALYLDDPDGNGLEIYRDRPRAEWPMKDGRLMMATEPIDRDGLMSLVTPDADLDAAAPTGTTIGHIHLQAGDLGAAGAFWLDAVGFALATTYPGALFMSAGGYHHHVAANVWSSRGRGPAPDGSAGLRSFEAFVPDAESLAALRARLSETGTPFDDHGDAVRAADPWGSAVLFRIG